MIPYYRISGGGNDFLALVEPESEPSRQQIRAWCSRGLSLGADGLFILRRSPSGARMCHFNADGLPTDLCLNGTRCAARLALHLSWGQSRISIQTASGFIEASLSDPTRISLELARPAAEPRRHELAVAGETIEGWAMEIGVPHFIVVWTGALGEAPVAELGPRLRRHEIFGDAGTNVDFVRFPDPHRLEIRSYERGVEAETLACGTGALAATAVGINLQRLALPLNALTRGGFELEVGPAEEGDPHRWSLTGDARILAEGSLSAEAEQIPGEPAWKDS